MIPVKWRAFESAGQTYDLSHLDPVRMQFTRPAKDGQSEVIFAVEVGYSMHCFTRGYQQGEVIDSSMLYSSSSETRVFDPMRFNLSKLLPEIVKSLGTTKCHHTGHGNFFIVHVPTVDDNGKPITVEYEVYFDVEKSNAHTGVVQLNVQSAYVRDKAHASGRPKKKKIAFFVILYNRLNRIPIKEQT